MTSNPDNNSPLTSPALSDDGPDPMDIEQAVLPHKSRRLLESAEQKVAQDTGEEVEKLNPKKRKRGSQKSGRAAKKTKRDFKGGEVEDRVRLMVYKQFWPLICVIGHCHERSQCRKTSQGMLQMYLQFCFTDLPKEIGPSPYDARLLS
jgi:hypothetical protein